MTKPDGRTAYNRVLSAAAELADLGSVSSLLGWDQETKMPSRGVEGRARVMATVAGLHHERLSNPVLGQDLEMLAQDGATLTEEERVQVREFRRVQARAVKVPSDLVRRLAELQSRGTSVWAEARAANDFAAFAPTLTEMIRLKREVAEAIGYAEHPYEALLDEFEPGARVTDVAKILGEVRSFLVPLVQKVVAAREPRDSIMAGPYDTSTQDAFGRETLEAIGFDLKAGRLDLSNHPFTSGIHMGDVRLTTRYKPDLSVGLFGTLHEAGHGIYEQNLPEAQRRTPLGAACSLGIHESQSRMWENQVGRSRPYWVHFYPRLQQLFPGQLRTVSLDAFYRAINRVEPSFVRVEADEVTYNLHIVLRFELECDLIAGKLQAVDAPEAWRARMKEYLGIEPPSPDLGVLQDIHWSAGLIGYFPTYTLGNLYAAQLYEAARRDIPGLEEGFAHGKFTPLRDWLVEKVHRWGRRFDAPELVTRATGRPPEVEPFRRYIQEKFGPLYGLGS